MRDELMARHPGARIVGTHAPPFRALTAGEHRAQASLLRAADADVVWVGLGTPRQDLRAAELRAEVPAVFVAVGAAFDFVAGTKRQAPRWMRRHGLEWQYRLLTEPRRLWRRYLFGNTRFLRGVLRQAAATAPRTGAPGRLP